MSRSANPFGKGTVLALLAVGSVAFLLFLYALGRGWTGDSTSDGGNHAAANGLNGFSGLAALLEGTGHPVSLSRNPSTLQDYGLQVLTPALSADADELDEIIAERIESGIGPTLLILPKWTAMPIPADAASELGSGDGWVVLGPAISPRWFAELPLAEKLELAIGQTGSWQGYGTSGDLPNEQQVQALVDDPGKRMIPLVTDDEGDVLAAELVQQSDYDTWPVIVVFEPDLLNNYAMADAGRARLAMQVIEQASDGENLPIRFDLTLNGLGASENLLTLAFRPPFLAATLCLLLAALVIGWRALRRFGPPVAEAPAMAQGKRQLARNGAALLERVKRWHLVKHPYEDMIGRRVGAALGMRLTEIDARAAAIDSALKRRGHEGPSFTQLAGDLRRAERPKDIIRAARRLRTFERTLTQ